MTLFIHFLHMLLSLLICSIFTLKPPVPGAISYDFAWVSRLAHNPLNLSTIVVWPSEVLRSTNRYIFLLKEKNLFHFKTGFLSTFFSIQVWGGDQTNKLVAVTFHTEVCLLLRLKLQPYERACFTCWQLLPPCQYLCHTQIIIRISQTEPYNISVSLILSLIIVLLSSTSCLILEKFS